MNMEICHLVAGDQQWGQGFRKRTRKPNLWLGTLQASLALASIQKKRTGEVDLSEDRIADQATPRPNGLGRKSTVILGVVP